MDDFKFAGEDERKCFNTLKRVNEMVNYEINNNIDALGVGNAETLTAARDGILDVCKNLDDKLLKIDGLKYRRMQEGSLRVHA